MAGTPAPPQFPWFSAEAFPTNGLFTSSLDWRAPDGQALALEEAPTLTAAWGLKVRRPTGGALPPGTTYHPTDDCPATGSCKHALRVGPGPDAAAPSKPLVLKVETRLVRDPVGAGALSCPDLDVLVLEIASTDDTTPREMIAFAAFIAASEAEVAARTASDVVFGYDGGPPGRDLQSSIALGPSVGRKRGAGPFLSPARFCFAVEALDWAGNASERSEISCLSTTDETDPTVVWVDGQGCACSGAGGAFPIEGVPLLLWLSRRRRARQAHRRQTAGPSTPACGCAQG